VSGIPALEQGNRGTGEQGNSSPTPPDDFDTWYAIYPRKDSKGPARTAYAKAKKKAGARALIEGAERYRDDPNREEAFTKLPATWLNAECWDDGPLPAKTTGQQRMDHSARGMAKGLEMLARFDAGQSPFELEA
jgi:hypothetical protein